MLDNISLKSASQQYYLWSTVILLYTYGSNSYKESILYM